MKSNLNLVRSFVVVAQTGSLTRAAQVLHVTQGAISQQISKLEDYLGVRLFDRRPRGLELTESGRRLFRGVSGAVNQIDSELKAARLRDITEELCVTCNASFAAQCLMPCLLDFEERHPNIRLRLETTTRLLDFDVDGIDVAIRQGAGDWSGVVAELLCQDRSIAVATPEFAEQYDLQQQPGAVAGAPLLYDLENPTEWEHWFEAAGLKGGALTLSRGFNDTLVMLGALRAGAGGVGLVGRQLVCHEIASGVLVQVGDVSVEPAHAYYLVYPAEEKLTPAAVKFCNWLKSWFGQS